MARLVYHTPIKSLLSLTPSEEEYLECIYRLEEEVDGKVKVNELAKHLGIKDPSVVGMLRKLKTKGCITYDRSGVKLTKLGKKNGWGIVRRHELAERLLSDVFKHDLAGIHEHACEFEHVLDDELVDKIESQLGRPETCPHGYPIPTSNGRTNALKGKALTDFGEGEETEVLVIPEDKGCVERLLSLNVLPGSKVKVIEKLPRGAILLQCGKSQIALSRDIATRIKVGSPRHRHRGKP